MLKISSINDWLHYSYASGLICYSTLFLFTSDRSHMFYFIFQVGVPGHIYTLQSWFCWHGTSSTLAIVDKMVRYRPLALQLLKGLPKSSRVAALLEVIRLKTLCFIHCCHISWSMGGKLSFFRSILISLALFTLINRNWRKKNVFYPKGWGPHPILNGSYSENNLLLELLNHIDMLTN